MRVDTEARGECGGGVEPRQSAPCVATLPEVSAPSAKSPPSYPQDASRVPRSHCGAEVGRCSIPRLLSAGVPLLPSHWMLTDRAKSERHTHRKGESIDTSWTSHHRNKHAASQIKAASLMSMTAGVEYCISNHFAKPRSCTVGETALQKTAMLSFPKRRSLSTILCLCLRTAHPWEPGWCDLSQRRSETVQCHECVVDFSVSSCVCC